MSDLSWLNPTPHAIAVYASRPLSPVAAQHSLPSGRYSLLGPDFHRLDRTSLRLAHSLDHLLGASKQYPRDHEAESLCRLEIDHKLEFRRCLHRKIRRLGAAENAAHVLRCAPELVYGIHAVAHQAPRLGKVAIGVYCRNATLRGERDDKVTMHAHEIIRHDNQSASRFCAKVLDGIFDLRRVVHFRDDGVHLELCRGLDKRTRKKLASIWHGIRIVHDDHTGELRHHLFQHLEI